MLRYLKDLVELRTKVASVFPLVYTITVYLYLRASGVSLDSQFSTLLTIAFLVSLLCFDMATTTLNHIAGQYNEKHISKYDQRLLDEMSRLNLTIRFNQLILGLLITLGIILGIFIVVKSSLLVLGVGMLCALVAISYSYGPIPLKNTFLGELASSLTLGMLVSLGYILSQDASLFIVSTDWPQVTINVQNIIVALVILLIPTLVISNIMLANNICDTSKDKLDGRVTLPILLGQRTSLLLWIGCYGAVYIIIICLVLLRLFPPLSLLSLISGYFVLQNIGKFVASPKKETTFKYAVFNLQIILISIIIPIVISMLI